MLFNIREEVKPLFHIDEMGDIYVVNDIFNNTFPHMFLAYAPKLDKMYTFNCTDLRKGTFVEYILFETTFDMIDRSNNRISDSMELMLEASNEGKLFIYLHDKHNFGVLENCSFEELEDFYIPEKNTYFPYNKELLNAKKG